MEEERRQRSHRRHLHHHWPGQWRCNYGGDDRLAELCHHYYGHLERDNDDGEYRARPTRQHYRKYYGVQRLPTVLQRGGRSYRHLLHMDGAGRLEWYQHYCCHHGYSRRQRRLCNRNGQ